MHGQLNIKTNTQMLSIVNLRILECKENLLYIANLKICFESVFWFNTKVIFYFGNIGLAFTFKNEPSSSASA